MRKKLGGKPDENQKGIVKALRDVGCHVLIVSQIRNSFDILVYYKGETYSVEIKQPGKKLTKGEVKFMIAIENKGVKYWVITSVNEALEMLNYGR